MLPSENLTKSNQGQPTDCPPLWAAIREAPSSRIRSSRRVHASQAKKCSVLVVALGY